MATSKRIITNKEKIIITKQLGMMPLLYKMVKHCETLYKRHHISLGDKSIPQRILNAMDGTENDIIAYLDWWEKFFGNYNK